MRSAEQSERSAQQDFALNSLFLPFISTVLLLANLMSIWFLVNTTSLTWVILNQLVFLAPIFNFFFFVRFVNKLEDIAGIRIKHCRWLLCLKPQRLSYQETFLDE